MIKSRKQILDELAIKWSRKNNCTPVDTFEDWLFLYDDEATVRLVYIAMQEYAIQEVNVVEEKANQND